MKLSTSMTRSNSQTNRQLSSPGWSAAVLWLLVVTLMWLPVGAALALVHFDFDQKFFIHPDRQVWDFSIVRPDSVYHIFYHTIHEDTPQASYADTIWHATSEDLKHWTVEDPVLIAGQGYWDEGAIWAPDVFFDPNNGMWMMAYTGCDSQMNQRICLASSRDLYHWSKSRNNPAIVPTPGEYVWNPEGWWSDFRDPFVFIQDDVFHMVVTAKKNLDGTGTGVLYHGVSMDCTSWLDVGYMFANDGVDPWRVLESPQYKVINGKYYLLFGEYDTGGISAVVSDIPSNWSMDSRMFIDYGYAPEVDEFDPGIHIISRIAPFDHPITDVRSYVARLDTLQINDDGTLDPYQPNPMAEKWESWTGPANLAQPTFGDNPAMRGEDSVGLVGNGFYGSREYYQGPLSGRGAPGTSLGDAALGQIQSFRFTITGNRMTLLVGGGYYPETCYVALVDVETGDHLFSETGNNQELMTERQWDLRPYLGYRVFIEILDQENGPFGHINVDEIHEEFIDLSPAETALPGPAAFQIRAYPNPFNPRTQILFSLDRDRDVTIKVHDLRGRLIWTSGLVSATAGSNSVGWDGLSSEGSSAPAGVYLYSLDINGEVAARGKMSLVK